MAENDNKAMFGGDDEPESLVLAVEETEEPEEDLVVDAPKLAKWRDRHFWHNLLLDWQIPIIFLSTIGVLSGIWIYVGNSAKLKEVTFDLEDPHKSTIFKSDSFAHFNDARRTAAILDQDVQNLPDPLGAVASVRIQRYLELFDTGALVDDDRFVINRVGDRYARTISRRLSDNAEDVSTHEIRRAIRWLRNYLDDRKRLRPDEQIFDELVMFHEEIGDRSDDVLHYEKALGFLNNWDNIDKSAPRYHRRARLHFKSKDPEDLRAAREYIEASRLSVHPEEVNNRHAVLTMLGKIYAHDGQIREAERQFSRLLKSANHPFVSADTSFHLGLMREKLSHQAYEDGLDPLPFYEKSMDAFLKAKEYYESQPNSSYVNRKKEETNFHIGSLKMFQGIADRQHHEGDLYEARDLFNRMKRRIDRSEKPFLYAINVRRAQVNTLLGRSRDAEDILEDIMKDHKERYWDRTSLVKPEEVVNVIHGLADVHENKEAYREQVRVLKYLNLFLEKNDKEGRSRNAIAIARAWVQDAEKQLGDNARYSHRQAAGSYMNLLDEPLIRFPKNERLDFLWSAYLQYKECFDPDKLDLWKVALARKDKDSAINILDQIINTDESPRTNYLLNQAIYLKGLLQEDLFRIDDAIATYEDNLDTQELGGDNIYIYLSYLQRARARASLGGTDNLAKAVSDCEELFAQPQIHPEAEPWRDARFLHGSLNLQLAMRAAEGSAARKDALTVGIRSLDEAIARYPNSPLIMKARVDAGLAKILLSKIDVVNNLRYMESAINDFAIAEQLAQSKNLSPRERDLKKIAMMNLGLAQMELEGNYLLEAARTFDRLSRAFRRDRVEPWALVQLHRTYRQLADMTRNISRQSSTPETKRLIQEYITESERAAEKAIGSWDQIIKLKAQPFKRDFSLEFWRDNDRWLLDLERVIDDMKNRFEDT